MNPKRCMKCLLHGESVNMHSSQECPWTECSCQKCALVDSRRDIANKMVKLARKQKTQQGINDTDYRYMCARCRNHGIQAYKKHHVPCPFALCDCEPCALNSERQRIERELKAVCKGDDTTNDFTNGCSPSTSDSESENSVKRIELSPEAKVIMDLINALTSDSFEHENFDYNALSDFFSKPYIRLPDEWIPIMGEITDLVLLSLKRFPQFEGIDFAQGIM